MSKYIHRLERKKRKSRDSHKYKKQLKIIKSFKRNEVIKYNRQCKEGKYTENILDSVCFYVVFRSPDC